MLSANKASRIQMKSRITNTSTRDMKAHWNTDQLNIITMTRVAMFYFLLSLAMILILLSLAMYFSLQSLAMSL